MGMQGNLRDMAVADLIQHNCQDRKTAQLFVQNADRQGIVYFKDGNVVHAISEGEEGEEVIYNILGWDEGTFNLEADVEPPATSIHRSWSGLLLEGARRLDESNVATNLFNSQTIIQSEDNEMTSKLDELLVQMSGEITGYIASTVVGMDGISIAQNVRGKTNPELISAQMTLLFKLVDTTVAKLGAGSLEDDLVTTENALLMMRFLPDKQYFIGLAADRKGGNLGNMRLMLKVYTERISKAMPR